jgi:hypothetical protein
MANPIRNLVEKHLGAEFLPGLGRYCAGLKQRMSGLAEDFWKDGRSNPLHDMADIVGHKKPAPAPGTSFQRVMQAAKENALWHAETFDIAEIMWGQGYVLPGGATVAEWMEMPLGLTKDMDVSAGLGGAMRLLAEKYKVNVTGMESDPVLVLRGKAQGIIGYDLTALKTAKTHDCIMMREVFSRVRDRNEFIRQIVMATKKVAQVSFTDFVVEPENRDKPAILAWLAAEKMPKPLGVVEMAEVWAKDGFNLRVHEDQSEFYRKEVLSGLKRFAIHLSKGSRPDAATKKVILQQIQVWVQRMAAMEQGLKFYRFYGNKL